MTTMVTRAGWGAQRPTRALTPLPRARGVKVHYTGGQVSPKIVTDHAICLQLMRTFQHQHQRVNGWSDFAYNLAACPHRRLLEGRGLGIMSAANGEGQNSGHYAILALVGSAGFTRPTDDLLHAVRDGIELLRKHGAGTEIKGHRDGYATSCPGGPLYAWIQRGAPRPAAAAAKPKPKPPAKPTPKSTPTEALVKKLPTLRLGDGRDGKDIRWHVKTMHYLLLARGYGGLDNLQDDTVFSPEHEAGVKGLQDAAGMKPTGVVDDATWALLLRVA
ncbi:peptidoglycan recognition protein family protein [Streptosporangium sp. DT93]|uniref:peptidoglycan recognition protein family protein n=1 Tax=Streptosporangium sp. DT93 TaxID=3393428 RepID=UPI003CF029D2